MLVESLLENTGVKFDFFTLRDLIGLSLNHYNIILFGGVLFQSHKFKTPISDSNQLRGRHTEVPKLIFYLNSTIVGA